MVSMLASSAIDRGFEPRSGQTKDYKIGICCFSAKHTASRRKSKDWLARNQNNVTRVEWHVYLRIVVSVSWHNKNPTKDVGLEQSGPHHHHLIENNLFSPWYSWKIAELALNNNHSLYIQKLTFLKVILHTISPQEICISPYWSTHLWPPSKLWTHVVTLFHLYCSLHLRIKENNMQNLDKVWSHWFWIIFWQLNLCYILHSYNFLTNISFIFPKFLWQIY